MWKYAFEIYFRQVGLIPGWVGGQSTVFDHYFKEILSENGRGRTKAPQVFHPCLLITFRCPPLLLLALYQTPSFQLLTFLRISWMTGHPIKHQGTQFDFAHPSDPSFFHCFLGGLQTPIVPHSTWYLGTYLFSRYVAFNMPDPSDWSDQQL